MAGRVRGVVLLRVLRDVAAALRAFRQRPVVHRVVRQPDPRALDGAVVASDGRRWVLVDGVLVRVD